MIVPDDAENISQADDADLLPRAAGAAGHGIDGGEIGGVVEGEVPGGVGGHGVAEHVDAGGIDVEAAGDVIHRLDHGS
jgi:hypothetical protein